MKSIGTRQHVSAKVLSTQKTNTVCVADKPTAAMNFSVDWEWRDQDWAVELWDTAGQEALKTLRLTAYDSCNVFVIGYDMCRKTSLENVPDWVEEIHDTWDEEYGIILVGTKYDMWLERVEAGHPDVVTEEEVAAVICCACDHVGLTV